MAEEKSEKTLVQEALLQMAKENAVSQKDRFIPAELPGAAYKGAFLRKWEWYQLKNIRDYFESQGIDGIDQVEITAENEQTMVRVLSSCLVRGLKVKTLMRGGIPGVNRLINEVPRAALLIAIKRQLVNCEVFQNDTSVEATDEDE